MIHATVKKQQFNRVQNNILAGEWRVIENFTMSKSTGKYRATKHAFKMNLINTSTVFKCPAKSDDMFFELVSFQQIMQADWNVNILIGNL